MGKIQLFVLIFVLTGIFVAAEDAPENDVAVSADLEPTPKTEDGVPISSDAESFIADVSSGIPVADASDKEADLIEPMAAPGVTNFIVDKITYTWTIKNYGFNNFEVKETMFSPLFWGEKSKDHHWQLGLFPRGDQKFKQFVGLHLYLTNTKGVTASVTFHIIDKNGKKNHQHSYRQKFDVHRAWGYPNFISQEILEKTKKADYLPNDKLTLMVEITFSPKTKETSGFCDDSNDDDKCLTMPYDNHFHNDIHLDVNTKFIAAQKAALAAHSTWFAEQLKMNPQTNLITLPRDVKADEMEEAVKFIYTGTINPDNADNLLALAKKLGMQPLQAHCEDILCLAMSTAHSASNNATENAQPAA